MTVGDLLAGLAAVPAEVAGAEVTGLAYDSRKVGPGYLFFAFPGAKEDGRQFARHALERGTVAVVSELEAPEDFQGPWIRTPHGRRALAIAANRFYRYPDRRVHLTGITGTNGKTTTSYVIESILRQSGQITALIGTIEYRLAGKPLPAVNTTPESVDLLQMLSDLENAGGSHAVMEVSSHALALGRVHGIFFETAVFTNLTRDHLDFHKTMEEYFAAKQNLFTPEAADPPRTAIINFDDKYGQAIRTHSKTDVFWYGLDPAAEARAHRISSSFQGLRFDVQFRGRTYAVESPLAGQINVYNILAAWCSAFAYGIDPEVIAAGIRSCSAVPGRFERVDEGQPFLVAVDYAHTDDALRNAIQVARSLTSQRVITVFGCGGDRDRTKRPLMGMAAAEGSDLVVLTSDNPRSEDPVAIMTDALVGIRRYDTPHLIEVDRERAIRKALGEAAPGDVVIVAGKGHERYQVLGDKVIQFDDREVARKVLRGFGYEKKT
jgi:UDP-N-acetylmuramoyl-L-alanyl-D-glutamate--2,6-diaminopimelate ligase